jgi:nanoRNase/pAp phosphatase (c-di-AMP/oligoRNAs hydrolase)
LAISEGAREYSQNLSSFLSESHLFEKKYLSVIAFTHRQADPDALCSAYSISELILRVQKAKRTIGENAEPFLKIISPKGASTLCTRLSKALSIPFDEEIAPDEIERADLIIVTDVAENSLLEPYLKPIYESKAFKILIDHHSSAVKGEKSEFDYELVEKKATSTCEIVANLYPQELLDTRMSKILLVGLLFDSQHLSIATEMTLEATLKLVRSGGKIDEAKELLRSKPDRSEVIARLKSSQRLKYREIGSYILAETQVSSFQASVARMLLDIGADIGIAYGEQEKNETRISIRTTQRFFREMGVDLGALVSRISKEEGEITGGGHATAASMTATQSKANSVVEKVVSELRRALL